jgi:glutamyl-tRNA synthetase
MLETIKTRIAPSPTGFFHIGTARTALFNYVFSRQKNGVFVLRIEDTDQDRSDKRFEKDIIDGLHWLGLRYDEFYRQSERETIYQEYINRLLKERKAFWCYHDQEELHREKRAQVQMREPPRHICSYKRKDRILKTKRGVIRLRGVEKKIRFEDLIRGEVEFDGALLGDIAIAKSERRPLYNLAAVIDDFETKITHVIRGEDHIPNTPKQILIQEALGIKRPIYAHLPLILGPDRSKLSKRHAAVSLNEYRREGYLPEAILNFMAFLGWNPGDDRELISLPELIKIFSLEKIQKGGAVFNLDKLNWLNRQYVRRLSNDALSAKLLNYIPPQWRKRIKTNSRFWQKIVKLERERIVKLSDITKNIDLFFVKPTFSKSLLVWKEENLEKTAKHIDKLIILLSKIKPEDFNERSVEKAVKDYAEEEGRGNVLWPFRVALSGKAKSPDPFSIAAILGKQETLKRLRYAKEMIYGNPQY